MILKRKIFVDPDYYKGLNEAEEQWLREKRSKLAKKYNGIRKNKKDKDGSNKKNLKKLREEINQAERDIRGITKEGPGKYVRDAVNKSAALKDYEAKIAKELADKELRYARLFRQTELLKKKKLGKSIKAGILIGAGIGLGAGLRYKAVKTKRENDKKENIKSQILK